MSNWTAPSRSSNRHRSAGLSGRCPVHSVCHPFPRNRCDIKEYRNLVAGNGSLSLEILERVVQNYIDAKVVSLQ